ncbi:MAG TPA: MlaD family protein [Solirubrobacteraceae bacterium]|nr:MlaD family protein [Solirubrobacteraceae bacterium]
MATATRTPPSQPPAQGLSVPPAPRQSGARGAALGALILGVIALAVLLTSSGSGYVIHARFYDAGQLVSGDLVTVGGHHVGSVGSLRLSSDGLADVELNITDSSVTPVRQGTIATIGQLSLTGVANRFVGLSLGMGAPIPNGGALPPTQTRGIVDLDTLLDALTPRVRASLQGFLKSGAYLVAQPTAQQFNQFNLYLNPALSQVARLGSQVAADRETLAQLVASGSQVSQALATHSSDLAGAVTETAATLREVASERAALQDTLVRSPAVLGQATRVLGHVNTTLAVLNPALLHLQPVAPRVSALLSAVLPAAQNAIPTVNAVRRLVPSAEAALEGLPPVVRQAIPAVQSLTSGLKLLQPDLSLVRPYLPDVIAGFFSGVGGSSAGLYDANGHYLHGEITVQGGGSSLTGLLNLLSGHLGSVGPFNGERTGLLRPCPGGGNAPALDASNPWTTPDVDPAVSPVCNPAHDQKP